MASVHILKARAPSLLASLEFATYNEAIAYARKVAALNPSKPYTRFNGASAPRWAVTLRRPAAPSDRAVYVTFPHAPTYQEWKQAA